MADNKSKFLQRVVSALLAAGFVFAAGYFLEHTGLYIICTIAIVLGIREFSRMAFSQGPLPKSIIGLFWLTSVFFYGAMIEHVELGMLWFGLANVLFFAGSLWLARNRVNNELLLPTLALGTFGMVYCVLLPDFAVQLVKLDLGDRWFWFLLLLVFAGDTFAYFGGRWLGVGRLMPNISPNKTWTGALAGLLGSALLGTLYASWQLPRVSLLGCAGFCLLCGAAAQSGDLLISLVKRVAQVKDSGGIMPGHGGVLDRLDGLFISCPLVYAFAIYVSPQA